MPGTTANQGCTSYGSGGRIAGNRSRLAGFGFGSWVELVRWLCPKLRRKRYCNIDSSIRALSPRRSELVPGIAIHFVFVHRCAHVCVTCNGKQSINSFFSTVICNLLHIPVYCSAGTSLVHVYRYTCMACTRVRTKCMCNICLVLFFPRALLCVSSAPTRARVLLCCCCCCCSFAAVSCANRTDRHARVSAGLPSVGKQSVSSTTRK